jgi:hypothetical protein
VIKSNSFTESWLKSFKEQPKHKRIDLNILEKMIHALYLSEQLKIYGLDFVFKGGTSLILLLDSGNRFSIDLDIICNIERKELEAILEKVIESSRFKSYTLNEHRSYKPGIPKAHYTFEFESVLVSKGSGSLLLDVLIEDSIYPEHTDKPIKTKWIDTEEETFVKLPTVDSITGDKLTAFAPDTIGIPYFKGKISFTLEICKQLFDLSQLFVQIKDINIVSRSFEITAKQEIEYRSLKIMPDDVLKDTLKTCAIIAKRGAGKDPEEKQKFQELQKGITGFGTGFLLEGKFRLDHAIVASAKVAYLASKLLNEDFTPIEYYTYQEIDNLLIENTNWNFLNKLKKLPDKSAFFYWNKAVELLT